MSPFKSFVQVQVHAHACRRSCHGVSGASGSVSKSPSRSVQATYLAATHKLWLLSWTEVWTSFGVSFMTGASRFCGSLECCGKTMGPTCATPGSWGTHRPTSPVRGKQVTERHKAKTRLQRKLWPSISQIGRTASLPVRHVWPSSALAPLRCCQARCPSPPAKKNLRSSSLWKGDSSCLR